MKIGIKVGTSDGLVLAIKTDKVRFLPSLLRKSTTPDANEIIHLNDITAEVLEKVLEWCTRHSDYNDSSTGELIRMQWDQNFFDDNRRIIKRLGNAAKYFEIETLKDAISVYESQVALCDSSLKA